MGVADFHSREACYGQQGFSKEPCLGKFGGSPWTSHQGGQQGGEASQCVPS